MSIGVFPFRSSRSIECGRLTRFRFSREGRGLEELVGHGGTFPRKAHRHQARFLNDFGKIPLGGLPVHVDLPDNGLHQLLLGHHRTPLKQGEDHGLGPILPGVDTPLREGGLHHPHQARPEGQLHPEGFGDGGERVFEHVPPQDVAALHLPRRDPGQDVHASRLGHLGDGAQKPPGPRGLPVHGLGQVVNHHNRGPGVQGQPAQVVKRGLDLMGLHHVQGEGRHERVHDDQARPRLLHHTLEFG